MEIPPGFRFRPTEGELVGDYLIRKNNNLPLPSDIINEVALYKYDDPDQLTAMNESRTGENEWYFFTKRDRRNGSRPDRRTRNGVWKASRSKQKPITHRGEEVGSKMHLVFWYRDPAGDAVKEVKTMWLLTEYKSGNGDNFDDWVLCKLYKNLTAARKPIASISSVPSESIDHQHKNMAIDDGQILFHYENVEENQLAVDENKEHDHTALLDDDLNDPNLWILWEELGIPIDQLDNMADEFPAIFSDEDFQFWAESSGYIENGEISDNQQGSIDEVLYSGSKVDQHNKMVTDENKPQQISQNNVVIQNQFDNSINFPSELMNNNVAPQQVTSGDNFDFPTTGFNYMDEEERLWREKQNDYSTIFV